MPVGFTRLALDPPAIGTKAQQTVEIKRFAPMPIDRGQRRALGNASAEIGRVKAGSDPRSRLATARRKKPALRIC